jgi:hypothetical protein
MPLGNSLGGSCFKVLSVRESDLGENQRRIEGDYGGEVTGQPLRHSHGGLGPMIRLDPILGPTLVQRSQLRVRLLLSQDRASASGPARGNKVRLRGVARYSTADPKPSMLNHVLAAEADLDSATMTLKARHANGSEPGFLHELIANDRKRAERVSSLFTAGWRLRRRCALAEDHYNQVQDVLTTIHVMRMRAASRRFAAGGGRRPQFTSSPARAPGGYSGPLRDRSQNLMSLIICGNEPLLCHAIRRLNRSSIAQSDT